MENEAYSVDEVKKKLKHWEYYFAKCHQRKPSKVDIETAPTDIKDSYKLYAKLKGGYKATPAVADSKENVDNVWGDNVSVDALKKNRVDYLPNGDVKAIDNEENSKKDAENWTEKLVKRLAKNIDRLPSHKSSILNKVRSKHGVVTSADLPVQVTAPQTNAPSFRRKKSRPLSIPRGWKDLVSSSSEEQCEQSVQNTKCVKLHDNDVLSTDNRQSPANQQSQNKQQSLNSVRTNHMDNQTDNRECISKSAIGNNGSTAPAIEQDSAFHPPTTGEPVFKSSSGTRRSSGTQRSSTETVHNAIQSSPPTFTVFEVKNSVRDESPDPYEFDEEDNIPTATVKRKSRVKGHPKSSTAGTSSEVKTKAKVDQTKKPRKRKNADEEKSESKNETVTSNVKRVKTGSAAASSKSACRSSKNANENFVKLNLKKKIFCRGKVGLKGAAYKRQQWKTKMSAKRGTACFKCGEEGHWANKCPKLGNGGQDKEKEIFNEDTDGFLIDKPADDYLDDLMLGAYTGGKEEVSGMAAESIILPLYTKDVDDSGCQGKITRTLQKVFGFKTFRPGQMETVLRIVKGQSTLVMLSTGAGKSLCYQLPAYMYAQRSRSIAVIISPLVSLMEDQVTDLPHDVKGVCIHTNQTETVRAKFMNIVLEGGAQFLLCSPEFMCSNSRANLDFLNKLPPISFACIDEAHCLSQWSHNFRPSYLRVCKILRVRFGVTCFLGLTATATKETVLNISQHLNLRDCEADCVKGTILPPNLNLSVSRDIFKEQALLDLLQSKRFKNCNSVIIYCTRREQTDRLASVIRTVTSTEKSDYTGSVNSIVESYHAGHSAAQRSRIQKQFMNGKLRIVVATVAFGMGLDKSDVRAVIHYTLPRGFESYVQEIGRAGRDGLPAECHLFLEPEGTDVSELEKHTYGDTVDQSSTRKLLSMIYTPCKCQMLADTVAESGERIAERGTVCRGHERAVVVQQAVEQLNITEEGLATLLFYLELHDADWLQNLSNIYSSCTIKCYGGLTELHNAAKKCIPLGVAMALKKKHSGKIDSKDFTFSIMDVADLLNKPSGYIKKDLKQLQWTQTADGRYKRTGLVVEFGDLALSVKVPGNMGDQKLDEVLEFLQNRVMCQERKEVSRLNYFYHILDRLAYKDYFIVSEQADQTRSDSLKASITDYFESDDPIKGYTVTPKTSDDDEGVITSQVVSFIGTYSHEHDFTGRDVAKILYGIASPNYPPKVWGKVRRFWRSLLGRDFNTIVRIAREQLIRMR